MFNLGIDITPNLREEIEYTLDYLEEMGYYVFSPTTTMDPDKLHLEYNQCIESTTAQKPVEMNAGKKSSEHPNCTLFNFKNNFNKKIAIVGIVERHTSTFTNTVKTVFRDPTKILTMFADKVLDCDLTRHLETAEYFPLNKLVRARAQSCNFCSQSLKSQGIEITKKDLCEHVFEICNLDGTKEQLKTDAELDQFLDSQQKSSHIAIIVGSMFGITSWKTQFKFSLSADKLYILSEDVHDRMLAARIQEKRRKKIREIDEEQFSE